MTQAEIETELRTLRQQQELRRKDWQLLGLAAIACALLFAAIGIALALFDLLFDLNNTHPASHQFVLLMSFQLIITALPLVLIGRALRERRSNA
jgi:hypothetical protein